ncbi:MAG: histone deacetylase [Anaerolineae bacterium]
MYVTHPRYVEHDLPTHPEHAGRIRAVWKLLEDSGLTKKLISVQAAEADQQAIQAVHHASYLDLLERISQQPHMARLDADTYAAPVSYEIARLAAGGVLKAAVAVAQGEVDNAMAVVRPPGHHAIPQRGMGFCLLNNVAIAARYTQQTTRIKRLLIVDDDVHHGNGTEAVFYNDPSVLFISIHQSPLYPGTGEFEDTGSGDGRGTTINIPLPAGHGDASYAALFEQVVWKAAQRFQPDMILASTGFDAHWTDPLAGMRRTLTGYAHTTRELIKMANSLCGGKIAFVMEGGYDLDTLGYGWVNIAHALLGNDETIDPLGQGKQRSTEPDISPVLERVKRIHRL